MTSYSGVRFREIHAATPPRLASFSIRCLPTKTGKDPRHSCRGESRRVCIALHSTTYHSAQERQQLIVSQTAHRIIAIDIGRPRSLSDTKHGCFLR